MNNAAVKPRRAIVCVDGERAGILEELEKNRHYTFHYDEIYVGASISLTMPRAKNLYEFHFFPPFFDGLLPEGAQLEALLRSRKIDKDDVWTQLLAVGSDLVGNVTVLPED